MVPSSSCASVISEIMPKMGLGTYLLQNPAEVIPRAIELGYRRIDCAPVYFNEDKVGDAIKQVLDSNLVKRDDLFVVSKLASPFHRREHVSIGLKKTLTDLRLEYLDLYLVHWPVAFEYVDIDPKVRGYQNEDIDDSRGGAAIDPTVSLWETWLGMQDVKDQGLARHIGLSNVPVALLRELLARSPKVRPSVNQVELHPYLSQSSLLQYCQHQGIHVQAYSPLGTPGYKEENEAALLDDEVLKSIAEKHQSTSAQVALQWALSRNTSVVCKATSSAHLKENIDVLNLQQLEAEDEKKIDLLDRKYRYFRPDDWWGHHAPVFD
eukprot:CAMPEP_0178906776 /NCGR_PEP_ID=MMETSP0786-20121207/7006_1 /TAXON_ID=186022 /ORGANISM="Thalassionema frauenfeldii, Strain CCMP 1798" /LENGTH=321 /DNA_ID=CAMNT_0020578507 /DNA_START=133 /DNA_END=1098 /DNA_ORIENTATION=-